MTNVLVLVLALGGGVVGVRSAVRSVRLAGSVGDAQPNNGVD